MSRRALIVTGVAAAAAGFVAGPLLWQMFDRGGSAWLDDAAFEDLDGGRRRLSEWRARTLVLNFWATWCAPCREEIPLLMAARERHAARGLEIVGIAIDLAAKVGEYAKALGIGYPVLVSDGAGLALMRRLGNSAGGLPFTVFVNREGEVAQRKLGALNQVELEEAVRRLLG